MKNYILLPGFGMFRRNAILFLVFLLCICGWSCRESGGQNRKNLLQHLDGADFYYDTHFIDFGSPSYRDSLVSGWSPEKKDQDGTTYSEAVQKSASLIFTNYTLSEKVMNIRCRAQGVGAPHQIFLPLVNGKKLRWQKVDSKYQDFSFRIPGEYLRLGTNWIYFSFKVQKEEERKAGIAFDYLTLAQKGSLENPRNMSPFQLRLNQIYSEEVNSERVLAAPPNSRVDLYLRVPKENAQLKVRFGLLKGTAPRNSAARFSVLVESEGGKRETIHSSEVTGRFSFWGLPSGSMVIPLHDYANRLVRLSLEASSITGKPIPERVYWKEVSSPASIGPAVPSAANKQMDKAQRPNVIIYLVDALRSDHLEPYGYTKNTSPRLLEFARDAVLFENAYSVTSWTRASVASIQTGLYPTSHLVEDRSDTLPEFLPSIASQLNASGYTSHAFITNGNISPYYNFQLNFKDYLWLGESKKFREIHQPSDKLHKKVEEFFETNPSLPTYLYIHSTDPHAPYTPEAAFLDLPPGCDSEDPTLFHPSVKTRKSGEYSESDLECVRALYDAEIRKNDHYFGKLLDLLKGLNLYSNTMIIFTADHGESFLEHNIWGHGKTLFQQEIRVPLIIHFPGSFGAGKRISIAARHIDIFPTILNVLDLNIPPGVQGQSLLPLITEGKPEEVPVFCELTLDRADKRALVLGPYKIIQNNNEEQPRKYTTWYELYDLKADPMERTNLAATRPILMGYMRSLLMEWSDSQARRKAVLKKPRGAVLDKETEETLKALGYLQ